MPGASTELRALIFDLDGTLAETEELHRLAFNRSFADAGYALCWSVERYRDLLTTTGGRRRIQRDFAERAAPLDERQATSLHLAKNDHYARLVATELVLRPGVDELIRHAKVRGLATAIATTTSRSNVAAFVGRAGLPEFDVIVCADDVTELKPDPAAYHVALQRLRIDPEAALAFEDSENGVRASVAAGLRTIVTPGLYTAGGSFIGAHAILQDLVAFDLAAY